jgi:putative transposase
MHWLVSSGKDPASDEPEKRPRPAADGNDFCPNPYDLGPIQPKGLQLISPGQRPGNSFADTILSPERASFVVPQSLSKILVHLIFSTKHREPLIAPDIRSRLHAYIVGILGNLQTPSLQTGGVADHVHILFALGRTISPAEVVEEVKKSSSKWMKADGGVPGFSWQAGYGAFSVGESQAESVIRYIRDQEQHHRKVKFQEEFRKFLQRFKIAYDERYVWD